MRSSRPIISIVALTPDGRFPIVRQYRPAIEDFTWELPAGLVDPGEDPAEAVGASCSRKPASHARIHPLGTPPCTGRLNNRIHSFFLQTEDRIDNFTPEPGLSVGVGDRI